MQHWGLGLVCAIIGGIAGWALCLRCCGWQSDDLKQEAWDLRRSLTLLVQARELGNLSERLWDVARQALGEK